MCTKAKVQRTNISRKLDKEKKKPRDFYPNQLISSAMKRENHESREVYETATRVYCSYSVIGYINV